MRTDGQTTEHLCAVLRQAVPPHSLVEVSDEVIDNLVAVLLSTVGKRALRLQIDELAQGARVTLQRWWTDRLDRHSRALGNELKEQMGAAMRPVIERLVATHKGEGQEASAATATGTLGVATTMLKSLAKDYNVPVQLLEALDDVSGLSVPEFSARFGNAPVDGVLSAVLGFAISATLNTKRYHDGRVRWDDGIDNLTCDTVKAGLTGILVSAMAGSLSVAPPVAIAAVVLAGPVIYAAVSGVVDHVYLRLLGGEAIVAARDAHLDYLQVADVIQRDLAPRLRQLNSVGPMVHALHALEQITVDAEARGKLRGAVRTTLAAITGAVAQGESVIRQGKEFEGYAFRCIGAWVGHSLRHNDEAKPLISISEIEHLSREVHRIYWRDYAIASGFKRITAEAVLEKLEQSQGIRAQGGPRVDALRAVVRHLCKLEANRPGPEEPILFSTDWEGTSGNKRKQENYSVFASDMLDLSFSLLTMEREKWPWDSELSSQRKLLPDTVVTVTQKVSKPRFDSSPDYSPREEKVANKHYVSGLGEGLLSGRIRLFRYSNQKLQSSYASFIAADASDEDPKVQCASIQASLRRFHPTFRADRDLLANLSHVENVSDVFAGRCDGVSLMTLQGVRVFCVGKYTATYKVASTDHETLGDTFYVPIEGYFRSLAEARSSFQTLSEHIKVVGVRPGALVLPKLLRDQLRKVDGKDLFLLQNQLLGRLAEGLIILDQLSNLSEARLAKLAGTGVFLSWWWTLSGRVRRELVEALADEQVKQAVRIELMEALLEVQRVHVLSHDFFRETIFAAHAKHKEELSLDATKSLSLALTGGAG